MARENIVLDNRIAIALGVNCGQNGQISCEDEKPRNGSRGRKIEELAGATGKSAFQRLGAQRRGGRATNDYHPRAASGGRPFRERL
ncbi:MAG: hypothetical protein M2R46_00540 [Verrucomicrobia subdivision 3 bacterium]|nr:hypothetical protein [Limisphaerales bacterium]